jgi:solute carrier family 6 GABA transporter-like protein 6/8/11/12/13
VDYYAAALSLMYIAFFETAAIVWCYGAKRLSSNVKDMTGKYPNLFFRVCWLVISPLLILVSPCILAELGGSQLL